MHDRNRTVLVFQEWIDLYPVTIECLVIRKDQYAHRPGIVHHQLFELRTDDTAVNIPRRSRLRRIKSVISRFTEPIGQEGH
ncbi:hypothetical protein D3C74_420750 [compost metagenome]